MSKLSVYDLNSRETWQEMLDKMQSALGMPTGLLDLDNIILQSSGERNELCREIRNRNEAKPIICGQSQKFMAEMARTQKSVVVEVCEAGMAKLVVPVFRGQNYLGSITACGAVLPETEIETYLVEKTTGIGEDAIAEMADQVLTVQKEQLQQIGEEVFSSLNAS
ncbi:PocR ligand-binding domain-containing protein [Desulfobacterales bacterium HSG17]|nr:PocR ligand-binding domain-containing protein [Desulfobacterales bacterium HSG17]